MKEQVTKIVVSSLCKDFEDALICGIEEEPNKFRFTIACIEFITSLREQSVFADLKFFDERIIEKMYREISNYLDKE